MDKDTYGRIVSFCDKYPDRFITEIEKNYIIKSFLDSYFKIVDEHKLTHNGVMPSQQENDAIMNALLNEDMLKNHATSANRFYQKIKNNFENDFKKSHDKADFWKSVLSSIIANLIYAVAIIILFIVAKDQIGTWILQLGS